MKITYELINKIGIVSIVVEAPMITGAEQDLILLDKDGKLLGSIVMGPGTDRKEIAREA